LGLFYRLLSHALYRYRKYLGPPPQNFLYHPSGEKLAAQLFGYKGILTPFRSALYRYPKIPLEFWIYLAAGCSL
jgi:hypothetical protein